MKRRVLIIGAGMLGKGFLGEVFDAAPGWEMAFLDKDPRVLENLQKDQGYTVMVSRETVTDHRVITNFKAFLTDEEYSCADWAIGSDLFMMPLYPWDFDDACAYMGPILTRRAQENPEQPLDIVCNTNYNHYIPHIREMFVNALGTDEAKAWFEKKVCLSDSIIRRSTIADSNYATQIRTHATASLLIQSPLNNDLSDVEWMEMRDNIELLKEMKLYTINGTHATGAYFGYLKGYTTVEESMDDPEIVELVNAVMEEASHGLTKEFPITHDEIAEMCECLYIKLDTPINDALLRVCWDPIRKIARQDRLTGNAMFCYEHGREPVAIMKSMANVFAYDEPRDPKALEIQAYIKEHGIEAAVPHYTGLPADHHITKTVIENYKALKK